MSLTSQQVHERLRAAARQVRWSRCARYALSGIAVALALLAVILPADSRFHFGSVARWLAFGLFLAPLLIGAIYSFRAARPTLSDASIARRIESAATGSHNTLISAVQFDRELPLNSSFRKAIFEEMHDPFPQVDWSRVLDLKLLGRLALGLGAAAALLALFAVLSPLYFANSAARILLPGSAIAPLTHTQIATLTPGNATLVHGSSLRVEVWLKGQLPASVWLHSREPGTSWQKALMDHEIGSQRFTCEWKEVREPLDYRVEAGDALSPLYQIAVRPPTAIIHRTAEIEPPAYARLGKETRRDFAALQGLLPGTRIALALEFNHPLAELRCSPGVAVKKASPTLWNLTGVIQASTTLRLDSRDTDGVAESDTLPIATLADEPPRITVTAPPEGKEIYATPDDALPISFNATDNLGLESVALYRTTDEKQEAELITEWKTVQGKKSFAATLKVPLGKYAKEDRVTLALVARDQNNVSGPGVTWSRPLVVTLRNADQVKEKTSDAARQTLGGFDALIKLQAANLEQTSSALTAQPDAASLKRLLNQQSQIADAGRALATSSENIAPEARTNLEALLAKEMPAAILALRNAATSAEPPRQTAALGEAVVLETAILTRLKGSLKAAENDIAKNKIADLISGVEELLRGERELRKRTGAATPPDANPLAEQQDALAEKTTRVRKTLEKASQDGAVGDQDFRTRIAKAAGMFTENAIYEQMLSASEQLQKQAFPAAATLQDGVIANLAKIVELLNQWQLAQGQRDAQSMKEAAKEIADKLDKLAQIQREVVQKSKEIARRADMRPEDIATAQEMKKSKDLMAEVVEAMLTDAHVFPDMNPSNELRGELTQIYEDVIQADKTDAAEGKLKPTEIAVQKEDSLLQGIEQAKKVAEDLEMWLPNSSDTIKWLDENFDKTEMPPIPNLPLPDAFEDLVGDLLDEQQSISDDVQDAASNQALAQVQQGWGVADGPMPGFSAQGKSGNTRPNRNEQTGRSSGGREGMSNGEMVGDTASNLEGSPTKTRRTNDPMQQGHIKDDGGIQQARATGGGKAGGFSDRNGMDGNAPLRASNAPRMGATDALAVKQALLAEKTSKTYGQASLLFLRAKGLAGAARLMDQSQTALKENRMDDFRALHQQIVTELSEVKGGILPGNVLRLGGGDTARYQDKQLLGGDEGQAPAAYQKAVADYYRSLQESK
jgi:osmotically-inducible protein OsmY